MRRAAVTVCGGLVACLLGGGVPATAQATHRATHQASHQSTAGSSPTRPIPRGYSYWSDFDGADTVIRRSGSRYRVGQAWLTEAGITCSIGRIRGTRVTLTRSYNLVTDPLSGLVSGPTTPNPRRFRQWVGVGRGWQGEPGVPVLVTDGAQADPNNIDYRPKPIVINAAVRKAALRRNLRACLSGIR